MPRKRTGKALSKSSSVSRSKRTPRASVKSGEKRSAMDNHENHASKKSGMKLASKSRKKLTLAAQVVQSLLQGKKKQAPSSTVSKVSGFPSVFASEMNPECTKPVPGLKTPSEIEMLPDAQVPVNDVLQKYTTVLESPPKNQDCCICCEKMETTSSSDNDVIHFNKCEHMFHKLCIVEMYSSGIQDGSIQCPICKTIYGIKTGNQPPGMMNFYVFPASLPGYESCETICVNYFISPGMQTANHPHPGEPYTCRGFPRRCYLPDNEDGRKILSLLVTAWERRLIFTVGTSATTGEDDTVTWNEIHHKTEFGSNFTGHGFPDSSYFENVLLELAMQGVVPLADEVQHACSCV